MKLTTSKLNVLATNPWFVVIGGLSSIIAFIWVLYDKVNSESKITFATYHTLFLCIALILLFSGYFYSIKVRSENIVLRKIAETFCGINIIYKSTLQNLFSGNTPTTDKTAALTEEERALRAVCQRIENIFSLLIARDCLVTIKLVTKAGNIKYAETYIRSIEICERDQPEMEKYKIDAMSNTAFYTAIQQRSDGKPQHFYSADLNKEINYANERQHYTRYYKSAIVVPIMGDFIQGEDPDLVGFLCVDTKSTNRINNNYHLYIMTSLASQMYNFISLMRGKYTAFVGA